MDVQSRKLRLNQHGSILLMVIAALDALMSGSALGQSSALPRSVLADADPSLVSTLTPDQQGVKLGTDFANAYWESEILNQASRAEDPKIAREARQRLAELNEILDRTDAWWERFSNYEDPTPRLLFEQAAHARTLELVALTYNGGILLPAAKGGALEALLVRQTAEWMRQVGQNKVPLESVRQTPHHELKLPRDFRMAALFLSMALGLVDPSFMSSSLTAIAPSPMTMSDPTTTPPPATTGSCLSYLSKEDERIVEGSPSPTTPSALMSQPEKTPLKDCPDPPATSPHSQMQGTAQSTSLPDHRTIHMSRDTMMVLLDAFKQLDTMRDQESGSGGVTPIDPPKLDISTSSTLTPVPPTGCLSYLSKEDERIVEGSPSPTTPSSEHRGQASGTHRYPPVLNELLIQGRVNGPVKLLDTTVTVVVQGKNWNPQGFINSFNLGWKSQLKLMPLGVTLAANSCAPPITTTDETGKFRLSARLDSRMTDYRIYARGNGTYGWLDYTYRTPTGHSSNSGFIPLMPEHNTIYGFDPQADSALLWSDLSRNGIPWDMAMREQADLPLIYPQLQSGHVDPKHLSIFRETAGNRLTLLEPNAQRTIQVPSENPADWPTTAASAFPETTVIYEGWQTP